MIAAAVLVAGDSGLVFFFDLAGHGSAAESWLLSRETWRSLHDCFGLAMIAGVGIHLLVHWKWIGHVALRQLGLKDRTPRREAGSSAHELAVAPAIASHR